MARTITVVARIPRTPTEAERAALPESWPVRVAFATQEDLEVHRRTWRQRANGFSIIARVVEIPPALSNLVAALKAVLVADIERRST